MGPAATVDFMATVVAKTPAVSDQDHIHLIVDNDPGIPARQDAILRGGPSPGPAMAAMAERLQAAGADFLVMPCNTAHAFSECIEAAVQIPLVSIIDVTVDACREYESVGLLATEGCLQSNSYQLALRAAGITLQMADALLQRGAQAIIAGCTEIPLVLDRKSLGIPLVSSTDELAKRTIALAQGTMALTAEEDENAG